MKIKKIIKKMMSYIPSSSILMIHHVGISDEEKISSCMLSLENFEFLMSQIQDKAVSIYKAVNKNGGVAVTFDDGYKEIITKCYPVLKTLSIPFTVFIVEDFIGKPGYLSISDIEILLQDELITIGSHGKSHQILTTLSQDEINNEIIGSKIRLENLLGKTINCFAYSHGQSNALCRNALRSYEYAFSANSMNLNYYTRRDQYYLPRLNITDNTLNEIMNNYLKL